MNQDLPDQETRISRMEPRELPTLCRSPICHIVSLSTRPMRNDNYYIAPFNIYISIIGYRHMIRSLLLLLLLLLPLWLLKVTDI